MSKIRDHYMPDNIVGPVTQSGGIPTGAIIESGSNANGSWTKYADGSMVVRIRNQLGRTFGATPVTNMVAATYTLIPPVALIVGDPCTFSGVDGLYPSFGTARILNPNTISVTQYSLGAPGERAIDVYISVHSRWF